MSMNAIYKNGKYYALGRVVDGEVVYNALQTYKTEQNASWLTFKSDTPFTLNHEGNTKSWGGILEYSTDGLTWSEWNGGSISSSAGGLLCLRGTGNAEIIGSGRKPFVFNNALNLKALGNIEYLLDWATVKDGGHPIMKPYCYYGMFQGCTSLTVPPELPATTLESQCYHNMFQGCT